MVQTKLAMAFGMAVALGACASGEKSTVQEQNAAAPAQTVKGEKAATPEIVSVDQAVSLFASNAVPVDANGESTRKEFGVIPGARLLTSSSQYDCVKELPSDKGTPLVFYCGGEQCSASDTAAERAMAAGYQKVKVLRAGISGWKQAGQKTETPAS